MTKLSDKNIRVILSHIKAGHSIKSMADKYKVSEQTIKYHMKKNQKPVRKTPKNNHLHRQSIINANGKPFSYSATMLFWGGILFIMAINIFFLWSSYAR